MSRNVINLVVVCLVALAAWAFGQQQGQQPVSAVIQQGRYRLQQHEFVVVNGDSAYKETSVFKVDTETGAAFRYFAGITKDGKTMNFWRKIED